MVYKVYKHRFVYTCPNYHTPTQCKLPREINVHFLLPRKRHMPNPTVSFSTKSDDNNWLYVKFQGHENNSSFYITLSINYFWSAKTFPNYPGLQYMCLLVFFWMFACRFCIVMYWSSMDWLILCKAASTAALSHSLSNPAEVHASWSDSSSKLREDDFADTSSARHFALLYKFSESIRLWNMFFLIYVYTHTFISASFGLTNQKGVSWTCRFQIGFQFLHTSKALLELKVLRFLFVKWVWLWAGHFP